jgi:hypothetical protein
LSRIGLRFVREVAGIADSDLDRVTDEVWTPIKVENYRHLIVERPWPPEQYESWLATMIATTLR